MRTKLSYVPFVTFVFVLFAPHANAQCCKLPDSLKVTSVTDSSFCVQWNASDTSQCDTAKAWQIRYKDVSTTVWKYFKGSYNGAKTYTFCHTVNSCTEYKWQVRNICINNGDSTFTNWVTGSNFTTNCNVQCCRLPDSLKVISVTDSSFCVQWHAKDTSACDTAKAFQIRYAPVGTSAWKYIKKGYNGVNTYLFCDTATPCFQYKWQVRNICIHSGDSTFTNWVAGANFTTTCDTTHGSLRIQPLTQEQLHQLKVTPNPATGLTVISGAFQGKWHIVVSSMTGKKMYETNTTVQGKLRLSLNVSAFEKGVYFITISDGKNLLKTTLIKE